MSSIPDSGARQQGGVYRFVGPLAGARSSQRADLWKLGRPACIEKGVSLARIEDLRALTGSGEKAGTIVIALQALGQARSSWAAEPVPVVRNQDFDRRFTIMPEAVALADAAVIPLHHIGACDDSLDVARGKQDDVKISPSSHMQVFEACRGLMATLLDMGRACCRAQMQTHVSWWEPICRLWAGPLRGHTDAPSGAGTWDQARPLPPPT
jgi:hypothetical protein